MEAFEKQKEKEFVNQRPTDFAKPWALKTHRKLNLWLFITHKTISIKSNWNLHFLSFYKNPSNSLQLPLSSTKPKWLSWFPKLRRLSQKLRIPGTRTSAGTTAFRAMFSWNLLAKWTEMWFFAAFVSISDWTKWKGPWKVLSVAGTVVRRLQMRWRMRARNGGCNSMMFLWVTES